jgi:nicotinate-nucleotide adenylyltransferase
MNNQRATCNPVARSVISIAFPAPHGREQQGQLQSAIMRIGFFGGSFDPPHLGHLAVGKAAAESFALDSVFFAPTASQPLKPIGATASFEDRLAMVSLLTELQPATATSQLKASRLDAPLPNGSPNYTANTLSSLRNATSPHDSIFVIVGADAFLDLRRWHSPEALFTLADWIVVSRPNFSLQHLDALHLTAEQLQRVHLLQHVHEPASATRIRTLLAAGSDCAGLLPPSILTYIRNHHLYGT